MSNASRNVRGILATAALMAGVNWAVIIPASAEVVPCQGRDVVSVVGAPGYGAAICDGIGDSGITATGGEIMIPAGYGAPRTVDPFARAAGLPGLSWASGTVGFTDAGAIGFTDGGGAAGMVGFADPAGAARGIGFQSLPLERRWAGTLSTTPDLPGLPGAPGTGADGSPVQVSRFPGLPGPSGTVSGDMPLPEPIPVRARTEEAPGTNPPGVDASPSRTDLPGTGTDLPGPGTDLPGAIRLEVPPVPENLVDDAAPDDAAPVDGAEVAPLDGMEDGTGIAPLEDAEEVSRPSTLSTVSSGLGLG
ncbi:hypothetical protein [Streptosporangium lutulentum]|uniref:Uncharacterized protein n=1 Tax=Streptosporangium lutulentum TaxID=1461250 RepID=A0ABT9QKQ6_9ACTN|nr:hypothetical protein [Streptosporangium lutulentum]MDP9847333.1 hypothetical protein [Streptosporangium lutulentum]